MGCFNESCSFTGIPIHEGEEAVVFVVLENPNSTQSRGHRHQTLWHFPMGPALLGGHYDDYGGSTGDCGFQDDLWTDILLTRFEEPPKNVNELVSQLARREAVLKSENSRLYLRTEEAVKPRLYWVHGDAYCHVMGVFPEERDRLEQGMEEYFLYLEKESGQYDDSLQDKVRLQLSRFNGPDWKTEEKACGFFFGALRPQGEGKINITGPHAEFWKFYDAGELDKARELGRRMIDFYVLRQGMWMTGIGWTPQPSTGGQVWDREHLRHQLEFAEMQVELVRRQLKSIDE